MVFIPMCFVFGLSVDVKNKVPSIIWEVELFLPELTSENLGDSHVLRKLGGRVLIGFTRMWLGPIVLCVFDTQFPPTQIHISQNRDLNALELPSKMEAQIVPRSQKAPHPATTNSLIKLLLERGVTYLRDLRIDFSTFSLME